MESYNNTQLEAVNHFKEISKLLKESDDEEDSLSFNQESPKSLGMKTMHSFAAMPRKMSSSIAISKKSMKKMKSTTKFGTKG